MNKTNKGPPSAPQNLVYNINQTTVSLEWGPPADTGGRNDVTYRVLCRRCSWEPEECVPCGPGVTYSPAQSGLVDTYVSATDLLAHANYTLEVEAVNGVSDLSRTQRLFAAVSVSTGQAVKRIRPCSLGLALPGSPSPPTASACSQRDLGLAGTSNGSDGADPRALNL
uniref:Fibronectin type-III domain-containing protein n=1 Tax=Knipowitschia caucasica TaxID=637954 RepID=A0AAV2K8N5_KNICA